MRLYIKSTPVQEKPGLLVYNEKGEKIYSASVEHSVLGLKMDVFNVFSKRVAKIRQHAFSFNKTYNITTRNKSIKVIFKAEEKIVSAFVKGAPITVAGDVLKKTFSILDERQDIIMTHKYNFKNYYELNIMKDDFELLGICIALCVETLLFSGEKSSQKDIAFLIMSVLSKKEPLGSVLPETFSIPISKFNELKNED